MRPARTELTLTEWLVLALVAEGRTHGWAVARALRPEASLGIVWSCRTPLVYRAIRLLVDAGLVREVGPAEGRGPSRQMLEATTEGHEAVTAWLEEPVAHVRDLRSELLAKLILLDRRGLDRGPLIRRQRDRLTGILRRLEDQLAGSLEGSERLVTLWRVTTAAAALEFLAGVDAAGRAGPGEAGPGRSSDR